MSFRYRDFRVYSDSKKLHLQIVYTSSLWPRNYYYLIDQIRRASLSVVLNIAEGSSKQSDADFNRFITISLGSLDEVMACLEVGLELQLFQISTFQEFETNCISLSNQLGSFSKKLKSKASS